MEKIIQPKSNWVIEKDIDAVKDLEGLKTILKQIISEMRKTDRIGE